ncbi:hypothetical protein NQZ68_036883 [Dissostichus eleginoides]|nr:hypothetical protein NQZ68_036883 [Dissostichus eleginoides]
MGGLESPSVPQVVLVGSSINERDQMLFISTDEGSSFQRQSISFTRTRSSSTLRKKTSSWPTARRAGSNMALFASTDLGRKWTLLQERVTKDKVFWSTKEKVSGNRTAETGWPKPRPFHDLTLIKQEDKILSVSGVDVDPDLVCEDSN